MYFFPIPALPEAIFFFYQIVITAVIVVLNAHLQHRSLAPLFSMCSVASSHFIRGPETERKEKKNVGSVHPSSRHSVTACVPLATK